jgi:hypothetical protein
LVSTECGTTEWAVYLAEAPRNATVILDPEHDRFEWVAAGEASARCQPELVARPLEAAVQQFGSR